jgi:glycerol-3-phosphate responsive antiterminator
MFRIMNLGGRISELRQRGHDIHTQMVPGDNGSEHAVYFIPRAVKAAGVSSNQLSMAV